MNDYSKGINYLDDNLYVDAEKCFEKTYKNTSALPNLVYYYAYTEYMLNKIEKCYKLF